MVLLLANVIYFKDAWTIPFDAEINPANRQFTLADGRTKREGVKTMTRTSFEFGYRDIKLDGLANTRFTIVSIPYKVQGTK